MNFRRQRKPLLVLLISCALSGCASTDSRLSRHFEHLRGQRFITDPSTGIAYGFERHNGVNHFFSLDAVKGKTRLLNGFPELTGIMLDASAIDPDGARFFFIGRTGEEKIFYVLSLADGKVAARHRLDYQAFMLAYNRHTGKVLGISLIDGVNSLVEIDPDGGGARVVHPLEGVDDLFLNTNRMDEDGSALVFEGRAGGEDRLIRVDLQNYGHATLPARKVGVDSFFVQNFRNGGAPLLYTFGVQQCVALSGLDAEKGVGFIAHFSPQNTGVDDALRDIDGRLREEGTAGLSGLHLYIAGGVRDRPASYALVRKLYDALTQNYGADLKGNATITLGRPRNVIMRATGVDVY